MTRSLMLIVLGALVLLSPISGLPMRILAWILPVLGLLVLAIGISYKREQLRKEPAYESPHEPAA